MTKRKGLFEGNSQFISPLPLEICYARLQSLENDATSLIMTRESSDAIRFEIHLSEGGVIRAKGYGSLRRWEGTLTRVDCEIEIHEGILRWFLLFGLLFLLTMIALPMLLFLAAEVNVMIWVGISVLFVAVLTGLMAIVNHYAPLDDTPDNLYRRITTILK